MRGDHDAARLRCERRGARCGVVWRAPLIGVPHGWRAPGHLRLPRNIKSPTGDVCRHAGGAHPRGAGWHQRHAIRADQGAPPPPLLLPLSAAARRPATRHPPRPAAQENFDEAIAGKGALVKFQAPW